jgi:hypothetical protein
VNCNKAGGITAGFIILKAFSSEVGTGSREENASKQKSKSPDLTQSELRRL